MAMEARGENERALFGQEALNKRYRELDAREARLDERDKRVTDRETGAEAHDLEAEERETRADVREREQIGARSRSATRLVTPLLDDHRVRVPLDERLGKPDAASVVLPLCSRRAYRSFDVHS